MENNGNQNLTSSLCKAGCGFFGNAQYDGMCSKCYKDSVKRKQAAPSDSSTTLHSTAGIAAMSSSNTVAAAACTSTTSLPPVIDTIPCIETGSPTVTNLSKKDGLAANVVMEVEQNGSATSSGGEESGNDSPSKSRKRNRCYSCKKKVGLTGFECRCGGVFCSVHRYSDKHGCEFDYKELGADHIRKNNPVVVGSKVQKL